MKSNKASKLRVAAAGLLAAVGHVPARIAGAGHRIR